MSPDADLALREAAPRGTRAWLDLLSGRARPRLAAALSNGDYQLLLTDRGAGYARFGAHALTRWSGDPLEDREGFFLALVDRAGGTHWSPAGGVATFAPGTVGWSRVHEGIASRLTVAVHPELPLELRRLVLSSERAAGVTLEIAAAVEVVLQERAADLSHPAFSRLFVQTAWAAGEGALLASRRPRAAGESFPWVGFALLEDEHPEFESDRARFLGRVRDRSRPAGLESEASWPGTTGNVLDPVLALRTRRQLEPGATEALTFVLAAGDTADDVRRAIGRARSAGGEALLRAAEGRGSGRAGEEEDLARLGWRGTRAPANGTIDLAGAPGPAAGDSATTTAATAIATAAASAGVTAAADPPPGGAAEEPLRFWNGIGGLSPDGRAYVIRFDAAGARPPQPWINVLANESFGTFVSETGAGTTWSVNSRERRLTPWSNDALLDPHGEALWLHDPRTGTTVSPLPGPAAGEGRCEARHGFGVSRFQRRALGLDCATTIFVPRADSLKVTRVTLTNPGREERRVELAAFQQLVLGVRAEETGPAIVTAESASGDALFAWNPADPLHPGRVAFAAILEGGPGPRRRTCDRATFLGGSAAGLADPIGLREGELLDGACGAGLDPCFAQAVSLRLAPGASLTRTVVLGDAEDRAAAEALLARWRRTGTVEDELAKVEVFWADLVGRVQVETPAPALDPLLNGWLVYQTVACRLWGRTAFHQSGGAFGFRDQLQDAAALLHYDPAPFRDQILLHAAHQFIEGDVLHWWHPPDSRGLRTRFADDLLWLPWLTATYVRATGDTGVLDEPARFLVAEALPFDEAEVLVAPEPAPAAETADVYEHGCRAIERSLAVGAGARGLPLFGAGDWNDGMNRVGAEGRGESVWMAFFLAIVLADFAPLCRARGDDERARRYDDERARLSAALEASGWDGAWYRRGYYDDGTPLGSAGSDECRIDALAQAWATLSRAVPRERAEAALDACEARLVDVGAGLIRLLDPPFEHTPQDPGYIKGYVPGVRENGGQYTHAALWVVRAMAELGRRDRAAHRLEMMSPLSHAQNAEQVAVYQGEPYVVAADVYGVAPHVGRAGWTWYTGSAGWMLRVALESILGVTVEDGTTLVVRPAIPDDWPGFTLRRRLADGTTYAIAVRGGAAGAPSEAVVAATLDGRPALVVDGAARIPLATDGATHEVVITLGPRA